MMTQMDNAEQPAPRRRPPQWVLKLLLLLGACGFALVMLEGVIRIVAPQPVSGVMYSARPEFGFWIKGGLDKARFQSDARKTYQVTTTEAGYRMDEPVAIPKPKGVTRVLVLGDSFTFGVGVENDETFCHFAEEWLRQKAPGRRWEVVNAGCPGWGTENMLGFWRHRGEMLEPDVVVMAFFRNDLIDNRREMVYRVRAGQVQEAPASEISTVKKWVNWIPGYGFLSAHSHFVNLLRRGISAWLFSPITHAARQKEEASATLTTGTLQQSEPRLLPNPIAGGPDLRRFVVSELHIFMALLDAMVTEIREQGALPILLLLPGLDESVPGIWERDLPVQYREVARLGRAWESEGRLVLVNGYKTIESARAGGETVHIPGDGHFNPQGHRLIGRLLGERLLEALERP